MTRHSLFSFAVPALIFMAVLPVKADPILLVWDHPVDLSHPDLAPFLAKRAMDSVHVDLSSRSVSLTELNAAEIKDDALNILGSYQCLEDRRGCGPDRLSEYRANIESFSLMVAPIELKNIPVRWLNASMELIRGSEISEPLRRFIHGTHITALAGRGLPADSVVTVPFRYRRFEKSLATSKSVEALMENYLDVTKVKYKILRQAISKTHVRVVNFSGYLNSQGIEERLRPIADKNGYALPPDVPKALIRQEIKLLSSIFDEFPNVLFIVAAGNDSARITLKTPGTNSIRKLNLVYVSNRLGYANTITDIASDHLKYRRGTQLLAAPAGLRIFATGTSISAPLLANEAAHWFLRDPETTVAEVIQTLPRED